MRSSRGGRWRVVAPVLAIPTLLSPQPRPAADGPRPELRVDAIISGHPSIQGGVGVNWGAGTYTRLGAVLAAGAVRRNGTTRGAGRIDAVARFLMDPFRESRYGLYGLAGASGVFDGVVWRPRLLLGLGVEGPPRGSGVAAAEVALGGGVRAGVVIRRSRPNRR